MTKSIFVSCLKRMIITWHSLETKQGRPDRWRWTTCKSTMMIFLISICLLGGKFFSPLWYLYCQIPLFLATDKPFAWGNAGCVSRINLAKSTHYRQNSATPPQAMVNLKPFGRTRVDPKTTKPQPHFAHNNKVKQNRDKLKCFINIMVFLWEQEGMMSSYSCHLETATICWHVKTILLFLLSMCSFCCS